MGHTLVHRLDASENLHPTWMAVESHMRLMVLVYDKSQLLVGVFSKLEHPRCIATRTFVLVGQANIELD